MIDLRNSFSFTIDIFFWQLHLQMRFVFNGTHFKAFEMKMDYLMFSMFANVDVNTLGIQKFHDLFFFFRGGVVIFFST